MHMWHCHCQDIGYHIMREMIIIIIPSAYRAESPSGGESVSKSISPSLSLSAAARQKTLFFYAALIL